MSDETRPSPAAKPSRIRQVRAWFAPIVVPLCLAVAIVAVATPFVRILSLDFQALMESLRGTTTEVGTHGREHALKVPYEPREPVPTDRGVTYDYEKCDNIYFAPPVVSDDWAVRGDLALRYGGLPLLALVLVGLGLSMRARRVAGSRTLREVRPLPKALLAVAAMAPFAAFAVPLALALCVWLTLEIYPWIQWYDSVNQLTESTILRAGPPLLGVILLAGAWALRATLRDHRRRGTPGDRPLRRWASRLAIAAMALVALAGGALPLVHAARVAPVLGTDDVLQRRCASCHSPTAPLFFVRTPDEWRRQLDATCFRRAEIPGKEQDEVVTFLAATRSFPDEWAFRTRCQRCHVVDAFAWQDRHPEDWEGIVRRVGRHSPFYYDPGTQEQIVRHLATKHGDAAAGAGGGEGERRRLAVRACTACHFFSRNASAFRDVSEQDAVALATRMSDRMARPMSPDRIRDVAAVWRTAVRDPEAMGALVPHDRPVLHGGLPW
jgi:hypothetical protein